MNQKNHKRVPGSPAEWLSHAESDLRLARLAANDPQIIPGQVCFHAQQAAEKSIKAAMLFRGIEFPLTHDIEELLEIAEGRGLIIPEEIQEADHLTPYAVETRYPGYLEEITGEDVNNALQMAEHTVFWAKGLLSGEKGEGS
jgi:HEPN domain-containing protein